MNNCTNTKIIDISKIKEDNYSDIAKEYSEGNKNLENLIIACFENNIPLENCCPSHDNYKTAYLQFKINKDTINQISSIIKFYYEQDNISIKLISKPKSICRLIITNQDIEKNAFFKEILKIFEQQSSYDYQKLPEEISCGLEIMLTHKVPNEYLEIEYSKSEGKRKIFLAAANPNYSDLYWSKREANPWIDNSIGIKGTQEKIFPILLDIRSKTDIEYANYLSYKKECKNNNLKTPQVPSLLEINYNISLDAVAKELLGKNYLVNFNNFQIESNKYNSKEDIFIDYQNYLINNQKEFIKDGLSIQKFSKLTLMEKRQEINNEFANIGNYINLKRINTLKETKNYNITNPIKLTEDEMLKFIYENIINIKQELIKNLNAKN